MAAAPENFDQKKDGMIWLDGKLVPWHDAQVHVLTHGLHYASSVFEGERIYNGRVFKLREHSERLVKSATILGMKMLWTAEQIAAATENLVKALGLTQGYVRPIVWRGSEQMGVSAPMTKIRTAIAIWDWDHYFSPEAKMKGIRLQWSDWRRPAPNTAPTQAKASGLYMICTMAKHKAESEGYNDAFMLDWRGRVAEGTGANFFMLKDGKLHTPTPDCFLNGITRQTVMELAKKRGVEVIERAVWPEELVGATEVFLTGTAAEITPIREIGTYSFTPGQFCKQMMDDYSALVREPPSVATGAGSGGKFTTAAAAAAR